MFAHCLSLETHDPYYDLEQPETWVKPAAMAMYLEIMAANPLDNHTNSSHSLSGPPACRFKGVSGFRAYRSFLYLFARLIQCSSSFRGRKTNSIHFFLSIMSPTGSMTTYISHGRRSSRVMKTAVKIQVRADTDSRMNQAWLTSFLQTMK